MIADRPIPHRDAWPLEKRREDMRREVLRALTGGWLPMLRAEFLASTYGVLSPEVEAEMMRHLQEGCDK